MSCGEESCVSELSSALTQLRLCGLNNIRDDTSDHQVPTASFMVSNSGMETLLIPGSSVPSISTISLEDRSGFDAAHLHIPIIGYEVMEERARFTVYKLRIENNSYDDCWFVFRRYTDFERLHSKPIFDALDETIDRLKRKLRETEWEVQQLRSEKAANMSEICRLIRNSTKICNQCKPECEVLVSAENLKTISKMASREEL